MRVFVIGGTRFMGRALVHGLCRGGHTVRSLTRTGAPDADMATVGHLDYVTGDRRDPSVLGDAVREFEPDVVVDMMCMLEQDAIDLLSITDCRLVVASSCDVYRNFGGLNGKEAGEPDPVPLTEESPVRTGRYPYRGSERAETIPWLNDYDKLFVEEQVLGRGGCVVRLPMVFGPNDYQHRLFEYVRRMDDGREAIVMSDAQASWSACRGFVEDMAHAIGLCAIDSRADGKLFNAAHPGIMNEADWVRMIGECVGWKGRVVTVPNDRLPESLRDTADFRFDIPVDSQKIRQTLGYTETCTLEDAIAQTVAWERENPPAGTEAPDYAAEDEALAQAG